MISTNNFLTSTNFKVSLDSVSYPGLNCSIQSFTLPSLSIGNANYVTPRRNIPMPGDKYEFSPLVVSMLLKEDLSNYETVFNWLKQCIETSDKPLTEKTSDIRLTLFNGKNISQKVFTFVMAFPSELGAIQLNTADGSDEYLTVEATFQYAYFKLD